MAGMTDDHKWELAIEAADLWGYGDPLDDKPTSDLAPLVELLESDTLLTPNARALLADLLNRHQLKLKPGGRPAPINRVSFKEDLLQNAGWEYYWHREREPDADPEKILKEVADEYGLTYDTFRNYLHGKRGASRRC